MVYVCVHIYIHVPVHVYMCVYIYTHSSHSGKPLSLVLVTHAINRGPRVNRLCSCCVGRFQATKLALAASVSFAGPSGRFFPRMVSCTRKVYTKAGKCVLSTTACTITTLRQTGGFWIRGMQSCLCAVLSRLLGKPQAALHCLVCKYVFEETHRVISVI